MQNENTLSTEKRMGKDEGQPTRHAMECHSDFKWESARIVAEERGLRQRKVYEGLSCYVKNTVG